MKKFTDDAAIVDATDNEKPIDVERLKSVLARLEGDYYVGNLRSLSKKLPWLRGRRDVLN